MPDPTNPHRLEGLPPLGQPALGAQPVSVVERSPTGIALLGQNVTRIAATIGALAFLAGTVLAMFLPQPWAVTGASVCGAIVLLTTQITGISPGIRTQTGAAPVVEKPRVGPEA